MEISRWVPGGWGCLKSPGSNRYVIMIRWNPEMMGNSGAAEAQKSGGEGSMDIRAVSRQQPTCHRRGLGNRGPDNGNRDSGTWDQTGTGPEVAGG